MPQNWGVSTENLKTKKELARYLGVSVGTIDRWVSTRIGGPAFIKVGNQVRFRPEDITEYLERRICRTEISGKVIA